MPNGAQALQSYTPTVYTAQVASAYKSNLDGNSSVLGNPAGSLYVYPNNPAGLSVLVDPGFNLWSLLGAGLNGGPILFNNAASPITVSLTAPVSNSYYATIYWNPLTNTAGVVYGIASTTPFPSLPDDAAMIPLAVVLIATGASQIQANAIFDVRTFWTFRPIRYSNLSFTASFSLNCAGASNVTVELTIAAASLQFTFANLQVGIPLRIILRANANTATCVATTPQLVAYTLQQKTAGAATQFANFSPMGAGASQAYNLFDITYYHSGSPYWSATYS